MNSENKKQFEARQAWELFQALCKSCCSGGNDGGCGVPRETATGAAEHWERGLSDYCPNLAIHLPRLLPHYLLVNDEGSRVLLNLSCCIIVRKSY